MRPAVVVDQELIDDQRSTFLERSVRLADQHALRWQVPVVQDQAHHQYIGARQVVGKEIARDEAQPVGQAVGCDIAREDRFYCRKIETTTAEVRMKERELDWQASLSGADINNAPYILPWKRTRQSSRDRQ